jgi:hypothetical protein
VLVDNRTPELASNDDDELAALLESLEGDIASTGYDDADLAKLLGELDADADTSPQLGDVEYRLVIECDDERQQAELLQRLEGEGLTVKALAQ